ncbi:ABC transporter permease [Gloeothece verrucosa]|uniref:ABC-2 type transporter n=1 Tax=Gloeothece verrucosa (strain PCC 7822) TaxID=497965 RepID=E0U9W4_GLOV7|nr:ABC transporter permease [Gloeothece verrucosa]ADN15034.1 ABC-2 type transporter [Gloeothece verrucosa PCC 7822]
MIIANIIAIYRKELQSYFFSPLSYLIAAFFWLISGVFLSLILDNIIQSIASAEQQGMTAPVDVADTFLNAFLGVVASLLLVLLPALSMGLYAEERKRGTLELLATSPLTNWGVAVGKLLGVSTFFTVLLIPLVIYEAIAFSASNPPVQLPGILVAHGALVLLAASILSLGMFISSLTDSVILSYILTFILSVFLWIIDAVAEKAGGVFGQVLSHFSLFNNFNDLVRGIFNTSSIVLFVSYIILGIFLTAQSIEALRFQRS